MLTNTPTLRGFSLYEFVDGNNTHTECSIQKSSVATQDMIWLGCNEIGLKKFTPGKGWEDIDLCEDNEVIYQANTRMHLTQEQVKELLPLLQKFVDTGELS